MTITRSPDTLRRHATLLLMSRLRKFQIALAVVALVALTVALWDLVMGGFYFRVLGVRVSSWEAHKPFRLGMLAIVAAI
jgi:hypothetical protein